MRRTVYIIAIAAAVLLVCALAIPFFVNADQFHSVIESELTRALGRQVKIGNMKLGLMSGTVTASDLSVADDPAFNKTPFLQTKALMLSIDLWQAVFSHKLNISGATIDAPETVLIQDPSGKWNFSTLGAKSKTPSSDKLSVSMKSLVIKSARLSLTQPGGPPQVFDNVSIEVKDYAPGIAFPFSMTTKIAGGGDLALEGKAGPIDPVDTADTPLMASFKLTNMNLNSGITGIVSVDGNANSDGHTLQLTAKLTAEKLKLVPRGTPVRNPLLFDLALTEDFKQHAGQITRGDISIGAVKASVTGTVAQVLKLNLSAPAVPVSGLMELLPALDIVMPSGAALEGGTASATLAISGPPSALTISGPVSIRNTRLKGFDLGAKMSPIEKLAGIKAGPNTEIETLSANVRIAPAGTSFQDIHLVLPSVGEFTGGGTISPSHALDFKMRATIRPGILVSVLTPSNIPFTIGGTSSNPQFRPDVGQLAAAEITQGLKGTKIGGQDVGGLLDGLFGGNKKKK